MPSNEVRLLACQMDTSNYKACRAGQSISVGHWYLRTEPLPLESCGGFQVLPGLFLTHLLCTLDTCDRHVVRKAVSEMGDALVACAQHHS